MEELKPCPFCRGEAYTVNKPGDDWYEDGWYAECHDCCSRTGTYGRRESAIAAWNMRARRKPTDAVREFAERYERRIGELEAREGWLLRCLENDFGLTASWDGRRKVWTIESTAPLKGEAGRETNHSRLFGTPERAARTWMDCVGGDSRCHQCPLCTDASGADCQMPEGVCAMDAAGTSAFVRWLESAAAQATAG